MSLKRVVPMLVALVLAGMLTGCGKDTLPTRPSAVNPAPTLDQAPPALPSQIVAELEPTTGNAVLRWNPSTSANVSSYRVYVYSPDPTRENAYVLAGETDASTTHFILTWTPTGTPYYRMCANSTAGVQSAWSTPLQVPAGDWAGSDPDHGNEITKKKP
jgi:hypothetical protein